MVESYEPLAANNSRICVLNAENLAVRAEEDAVVAKAEAEFAFVFALQLFTSPSPVSAKPCRPSKCAWRWSGRVLDLPRLSMALRRPERW